MRRVGATDLEQLPRVVQSLPDPTLCSDVEVQLVGVPPPPRALAASAAELQREVTRARVFVDAGRADQALDILPDTVERARRLDYAPLLAEALLALGHAKMSVSLPSAVPVLDDAVNVAAAEAMDALLVEAWSRRAFAAKSSEPEGVLNEAHLLEQLAKRPACTPFARALFYNTLGTVELAMRHRDVARAHFERALAESPTATTRRALELVNIRANLALVTDDRARADRLLVEAAAELSDRLGPDHPDTLAIRHLRGSVTIDDLRQANEVLTAVCNAYAAYPAAASSAERCWIELGMVRSDLGLLDGAAAAMAHAVQPSSSNVAAAPYLALFRGDARAARRQFAEALATPAGNKPWDHTSHGMLALGLGIARRALGDLRGARDALHTAIAELGEVEREYPAALYERRIGRGQIELARTLAALGERSAERTAVESAAAAWRARAGPNVTAFEASPVP
jgi:tetratricopeptide (TPR) repeat protein